MRTRYSETCLEYRAPSVSSLACHASSLWKHSNGKVDAQSFTCLKGEQSTERKHQAAKCRMSLQCEELGLSGSYGVVGSFPKSFGYGVEEPDMEDSSTSDDKPRILLMGLRRSGKSSIQKVWMVIFISFPRLLTLKCATYISGLDYYGKKTHICQFIRYTQLMLYVHLV